MKLSQEKLKAIACISMLLDHIGAVFFSGNWLRIVGRLAFPIYCFLLAEGIHYTKNPRKYGLRLLLVLALSELPFDLLFFGGIRWDHQNVMVTLLLAFWMGMGWKRFTGWKRGALMALFVLLGELLHGDYGGMGVLLVAAFLLAQENSGGKLFPALVLLLMGCNGSGFTAQIWALAALIPISLYSGKKESQSKALQWGFTLFYPAHLCLLLFIKMGI